MNVLGKATIGGAALSLALFAVVASRSFAQTPPPPPPAGPASGGTPTHEQVHQTLDDMHGAGTSQRMHEIMGPDADRMIDQFVAMQDMMQQMHAMMGDGGMAAMPDDQRQMMQDMMRDHHAMMRSTMLQMMGMMSSGVMPMDVMRDHRAMMQQMMDIMQRMMGMMSSGMMTTDMMRDHHAMMQSMMQQMMAMMEGMQRGGRPGPAPAPAQIPRR